MTGYDNWQESLRIVREAEAWQASSGKISFDKSRLELVRIVANGGVGFDAICPKEFRWALLEVVIERMDELAAAGVEKLRGIAAQRGKDTRSALVAAIESIDAVTA
jgi:hypothetical protein